MHSTTLVEVVRALGKRDRAELMQWVGSSFVNRRPEVTRLCKYLCQHVPMSDQPDSSSPLSKEEVYRHAFPEQRIYDGPRMRHTISYLFKALKNWVAWKEWKQDETLTQLYLCKALRKKVGERVFKKEFRALTLAPVTRQSIDYHLAQYQIRFEKWEAEHRAGIKETDQLMAASASFGAFVAASALRHGCAALDKSGAADFEPESIYYLPETIGMVSGGAFGDIPAVQIYYYCYRIMEEGKDNQFSSLKILLAKNSDLFPAEEMRDVYMVAINFCIRRLNTGARAYVREAFDLYRNGLEQGIMLDHGRMTKSTYQNIMQLALALNEWAWARQFLDDYRQTLAPGERHNAYHFNLAMWYFRKKEYEAAQEILRSVEFRDVGYNLDARRMMVRKYYDRGEVMALDSLLHSFVAYLQRHRNVGYHRDLNLNFVRYVRRLIQSEPGNAAALEKLRVQISQEKYLAEREWLLEKAGFSSAGTERPF
ncbi:MAG: hypothetical protein H6575_13250 [Lewinellaceae bacterium]|nr:hypothetical protein [Saprospiraceae bacterium]MCB9355528.1 hypothetical protein [Lewinellaceae bacterium]